LRSKRHRGNTNRIRPDLSRRARIRKSKRLRSCLPAKEKDITTTTYMRHTKRGKEKGLGQLYEEGGETKTEGDIMPKSARERRGGTLKGDANNDSPSVGRGSISRWGDKKKIETPEYNYRREKFAKSRTRSLKSFKEAMKEGRRKKTSQGKGTGMTNVRRYPKPTKKSGLVVWLDSN